MYLLLRLSQTSFFLWLKESSSIWAYPTVLTLHTVGLALLVGFTCAIDLRILGIAPGIALRPMECLFRFIWIGFWINAISGTLLLLSDPNKLLSVLFIMKMSFIAIGVFLIWLIRKRVFPQYQDSPPATSSIRILAAISVFVWIAAITSGRLMAYFQKGHI